MWVKVVQSCPNLCNPIDYTVHGILQARILEWAPFAFSRGSFQPRDRTQVSRIAGRFFNQLSHKGSPRILEWVAYPFWVDLPDSGILGLLHCRWILNRMSYQGSPAYCIDKITYSKSLEFTLESPFVFNSFVLNPVDSMTSSFPLERSLKEAR